MKTLLDRLNNGVVLGAEGYLFELERRGYVKAGPFVPEVVLDEPEAVRQLHREFLRAGAEVMVAFTYYAHRSKLGKIGRTGELEQLNRAAVRLAAEVAREGDALVAGNLSNTWEYDPQRPEDSGVVVRSMFEEQVRWSADEGVDFFIAETFSHLGEALIALETIKDAGFPSLVTFIPSGERSADGYEWEEACRILEDRGADVVGLNCGRGPATMMPLLERIRRSVRGFVAAQPVPYRTTDSQPAFHTLREPGKDCAFPLALDPFTHTRDEMADFARRAAAMGINYIGICCGGAPHHVRSMAEALGRKPPASRYSPDLSLHPFVQNSPYCRDDEPPRR
jgi:betaine-homocysteine S-methyltransferase